MAGGFRGGRIGIMGRMGPAAPSVIPSAASGVISLATGQSTFSLTTLALGTTIFPFAPIQWNTVNKRKPVATRKTWASAQVEEWPIVSGANGVLGLRVTMGWPIMSGANFLTLRSYFESSQQVTWNPGARSRVISEKYLVTIVELKQAKNHRIHDYVKEVEMTVEIRGIAP